MLRPPQPAVYIFLMDVSRQAVETGYINSFCNVLLEELDKLPGDSRTQVKIHDYYTYVRNGTNILRVNQILNVIQSYY